MRLAWLALGLVAACTKQNEHVCVNGNCPSSDFPFCDVGGEVGGFPGLCIAADCTPGEFAACRSDGAITCNATGTNYDVITCEHGCSIENGGCNVCTPDAVACDGTQLARCGSDGVPLAPETCLLGCVDAPAPHCRYIEPRYIPDVCDAPATVPKLSFASSGTFDVDLDTNCTGGVFAQTGGPSICVVHAGSLTIDAVATVKIVGTRALAFVADGQLSVAGVLDASADGTKNGPGGGVTISGAAPTATLGNIVGGGGSGFKTAGAAGGTQSTDGGAGNGGAASMDPALLTALIGGPRSTSTGDDVLNGGGGGGAITLISCQATVSISGTIDVGGGGGGGGGPFLFGSDIGGFAGGAGGYVVIQAATSKRWVASLRMVEAAALERRARAWRVSKERTALARRPSAGEEGAHLLEKRRAAVRVAPSAAIQRQGKNLQPVMQPPGVAAAALASCRPIRLQA